MAGYAIDPVTSLINLFIFNAGRASKGKRNNRYNVRQK